MVTPAAGSVVVVRFPFSDLSDSKLRPAVVLADSGRGDWVLCQVTSNPYADPIAVEIGEDSFLYGTLHRTSYARPAKLFTANQSLMAGKAGQLKKDVLSTIVLRVIHLFQQQQGL